ncbi:hypothetical protein LCGC14_3006800 [marine sediment metagenome]|uniref:Uncharacterized protein n=1 Tax=marine sediment metagenome TaxID=412755 RepID=A0A0F8ZQM0_9ZZZZ
MNKIEVSTEDGLAPKADLMLIFGNMRELRIVVGQKVYEGDFVLHEQDGVVELHYPAPKKGRPKMPGFKNEVQMEAQG